MSDNKKPDVEDFNELAEKTVEYFNKTDSWIVNTECIIHDAQEVRRHEQLGLSEEPPKKIVKYAFHLSDVEDLTQHFMQIEEDGDYREVTIVQKFSGKSLPITTPFNEIYDRYLKFHKHRDNLFEEKLDHFT